MGGEKTKLECNLEILELLKDYYKKNPNARFHQGLYDIFDYFDKYHDSSSYSLDYLQRYMEKNA